MPAGTGVHIIIITEVLYRYRYRYHGSQHFTDDVIRRIKDCTFSTVPYRYDVDY
jgi:hypothetical protein